LDGFERRKRNKMNDMISVSKALFSERGITDVSIAEIAKAAHVSQVSIYNYFGSKDALAKAVLEDMVNEAIARFDDIIDSDISFNEKFEKLVLSKMNTVGSINAEFIVKLVKSDNMLLIQYLSDLYEKVSKPLIKKFIDLGKCAGEIDKNVSDKAITFFIDSFFIASDKIQDNADTKFLLELTQLYFYGLRGKSHET